MQSDAQLAELLGYTPGAIVQWKRRGSIPDKALKRVESYRLQGRIAARMDERRNELGHQVLYEGLCLALYLAPSLDVAASRRFPQLDYSITLRTYASFFNEIALVCAEEVAGRIPSTGGAAIDALASLTQDDPADLYVRVMRRAHAWRLPTGPDEPFAAAKAILGQG